VPLGLDGADLVVAAGVRGDVGHCRGGDAGPGGIASRRNHVERYPGDRAEPGSVKSNSQTLTARAEQGQADTGGCQDSRTGVVQHRVAERRDPVDDVPTCVVQEVADLIQPTRLSGAREGGAECGSPRPQPNPPDRVQSAPLFVKASAAERCHSCYELPNPRSYGLFRGGPLIERRWYQFGLARERLRRFLWGRITHEHSNSA
jgi:hypothetical protein